MSGDPDAADRSQRSREAIRDVLEDADQPLRSSEILRRIDRPVGNGMTMQSVGIYCGQMDDVERVNHRSKAAKWVKPS